MDSHCQNYSTPFLSHDQQRADAIRALDDVRKQKQREYSKRNWAKYGPAICERRKQERRALGIAPKKLLSEEERRRNARNSAYKSVYGITLADKDALFAAQGKVCAICKTTKFGKRSPHTDHCHKTGKVRGVLCARCNRGLAYFRDDPELFRAAADYLEEPK